MQKIALWVLCTAIGAQQPSDAPPRIDVLRSQLTSSVRLRPAPESAPLVGQDGLVVHVVRTSEFQDKREASQRVRAGRIQRTIAAARTESSIKWDYPDQLRLPPGGFEIRGESPLVGEVIDLEWDAERKAYIGRHDRRRDLERHIDSLLFVPDFALLRPTESVIQGDAVDLDPVAIQCLLSPLGNPSVQLEECAFAIDDLFVGRLGLVGGLGFATMWQGSSNAERGGSMRLAESQQGAAADHVIIATALDVCGKSSLDPATVCNLTGITFSDYAEKAAVVVEVQVDWTVKAEGRVLWDCVADLPVSYVIEGKQTAQVSAAIRMGNGRVDRPVFALEGDYRLAVQVESK